MKGLVILADGFEDTEAIMTIDILRRAGFDITTATPNPDLHVTSSFSLHVVADEDIHQIQTKYYEFLVIPGGRAVSQVLTRLDVLENITRQFYDEKKLIGAICAAPSLLIQYGLLKNIEYTCFPGYENLIKAPLHRNVGVCITPQVITGKAMGYTQEFALALIQSLEGKPLADKVFHSMRGEK